jgi:F-type H+-transporting ATPase subunit epsilon
MATEFLKLDIVTPVGPVARGGGISTPGVEIPGGTGEMGILPNHVPIVSPVRAGVVRFRDGDSSRRVAVGPGFVEVGADGGVTVLVSRAVSSDEVDRSAVEAELDEVKKALESLGADEDGKLVHLQGEREYLEAQLRAVAH